MAVRKYMENIPRMETLPIFCILVLVGLEGPKEDKSVRGALAAVSSLELLQSHLLLLILLAELRVDGQNLRVTDEGEGQDGDGVSRLQGSRLREWGDVWTSSVSDVSVSPPG